MRSFILAIVTCILLAGCGDSPRQHGPVSPDQTASIWQLESDVRFLADDLLEGREAGTVGHDIAARYVAERFRAMGLTPGGDDGAYFQKIPMLGASHDREKPYRLTVTGTAGDIDLPAEGNYFLLSEFDSGAVVIEAPIVFAGFCFESERYGRNDFADLDFNGKIAACLPSAPKYLNSEERAHFGSWALKQERLSDRGAIGVIGIWTTVQEERFPYKRLEGYMNSTTRMGWLTDDGAVFSTAPNIKARAGSNRGFAKRLFDATGHSWDDMQEAAESDEGDVQGFDMQLAARMEVNSLHRQLTTSNVVGIIPGSDPVLRDEYVILSAHLDHIGITTTDDPDDDEINNGAMDNATGVAAILEAARLFAEAPPKRSVLVIALTAEEKGLVGSDYFARNPTILFESIVATINLDMPIVNFDFTDVVAFGAERSTLFPVVEATARQHNIVLSPDPVPDEGSFTRSDHYRFVQQGIPSIWLVPGFAGNGEAAQVEFIKTHYHKPSDEIGNISFDVLRRFTNVNAEIARKIANMPVRPVWKAGDFFGTTFNGPMEK